VEVDPTSGYLVAFLKKPQSSMSARRNLKPKGTAKN
jgi:hypothetical protein